jgi:3-hydroxyacyl-CoA dehydrogenase
MMKPFRTAAVLGAGVMGAQIAAHLANAGLDVLLLDLPATSGSKNGLVEGAFKKALKLSPPIFFTETIARRVRLGNYDDDFHRLSQVDWVIEAVVEKLSVKQQLMEKLEAVVGPETVISSNTSGLPIHAIAQGRSASFRQRFLGTHFFNPPRYLKLLELIPTPETDPTVLLRMKQFGEIALGKGVVIAKDTPNFIGNRIGLFLTHRGN